MGNINILDIGCGIGQNLNLLSKKGNYYGIDISSKNIENNKKKFPKYKFAVADITNKTIFKDGFFDQIFCYDVLEHVDNLDNALNEIYRIINKKTGKLIIEVPTYFSEYIFIKLNPNYNDQVGHKRNLKENEWIEIIQKHSFFLYQKKNKKFNDFLYLTHKFFRGKNIINDMGEFNEDNLSYKDKLNEKIWLLNNQLTNKLYSPIYGKSLRLEFKTKICKFIKHKNNIHIIEKIIFKNQNLNKENQNLNKENQKLNKDLSNINKENKLLKLDLNKIQSSKTYKLWQKYNKIKKIILLK
jgi:ubiquinone/menaquinone biosynthesis C-methylase UbiE